MKTVALMLDSYNRTVAVYDTQATARDAAMEDLSGLKGLNAVKVPGGYHIRTEEELRYRIIEVRVETKTI